MRLFLAAVSLFFLALPAFAQEGLEPVTLQLKWKHQFQFAGYYAALEKGYYRNAGFDVRILESDGSDTIAAVLSGKADYGVASSELALRRGLGDPVVVVATIMQHSALALAVRGSAKAGVADLKGRRVMLSPHDQEIVAYLEREGLRPGNFSRVPQSFDIQDLISGKVDAFSVYVTDQVFHLRQAKVPHTLLSPREAGVDFYGDTLFTSEGRLRADRARVEAFRDASVRGWDYAMAHPQEIAELIRTRYSQRLSEEHLLFEAAQMKALMQPELIEIGHSNPARWQRIAAIYSEIGMLPRDWSIDGLVLDSSPVGRDGGSHWGLGALALAAVAALLWALRQARLNRWLRRQLATARGAAAPALAATLAGEDGPLRDAPTGLHTRAYLREALAHELRRGPGGSGSGGTVAVVLLELQQYRQIAETESDSAANALLDALAGLLRQHAGAADLTGRLDAATLGWVLPGADAAAATRKADALATAFAASRAWSGLIEVRGTVACTVRESPRDGQDAAALLARP